MLKSHLFLLRGRNRLRECSALWWKPLLVPPAPQRAVLLLKSTLARTGARCLPSSSLAACESPLRLSTPRTPHPKYRFLKNNNNNNKEFTLRNEEENAFSQKADTE